MNATIKSKIENFYQANKAQVDVLAKYLSVPPLWLVALFYNESGLNPQAHNSIGAVGLNQMLPSTLAGLNSSPGAYLNGGTAYQLVLMQDYFKPIKGRIKRAGDLYLYNFLPAAVIENAGVDFVLGERGSTEKYHGISKAKIYEQNKGLDYNKDGKITRRDFWEGFEAKYDEVIKADSASFFFRDLAIDLKTNWAAWVAVVVALIAIVIIVLKYI
jgi:hypothetical protein